jgi:hypothetical protein
MLLYMEEGIIVIGGNGMELLIPKLQGKRVNGF